MSAFYSQNNWQYGLFGFTWSIKFQIMEDVIYNAELVIQLQTIRKATEQFSKEDRFKSADQLIAEIDIIKSLLDHTRNYVTKTTDSIL